MTSNPAFVEYKISDNQFDFGQFYFSYAKYHYNPT